MSRLGWEEAAAVPLQGGGGRFQPEWAPQPSCKNTILVTDEAGQTKDLCASPLASRASRGTLITEKNLMDWGPGEQNGGESDSRSERRGILLILPGLGLRLPLEIYRGVNKSIFLHFIPQPWDGRS